MVKKILYFDLDDVILDTSKYVLSWHNKKNIFEDVSKRANRNIHEHLGMTWDECWNQLPQKFWETVPFAPWGRDLINLGEKYFKEIFFLSSPIPNGICFAGKQLFVNKHLPRYKNRLILCHKKYASVGSDGLLIDDSYLQEEQFKEHNKVDSFYLFPAYQNRLHETVHNMYTVNHVEKLKEIEELFKNVY